MSNHTADVLLHIDESLNDKELNDVNRDVAFQQGVRTACVSCKDSHLMLIGYDPMQVTSRFILDRVMSRGLHAELVGF